MACACMHPSTHSRHTVNVHFHNWNLPTRRCCPLLFSIKCVCVRFVGAQWMHIDITEQKYGIESKHILLAWMRLAAHENARESRRRSAARQCKWDGMEWNLIEMDLCVQYWIGSMAKLDNNDHDDDEQWMVLCVYVVRLLFYIEKRNLLSVVRLVDWHCWFNWQNVHTIHVHSVFSICSFFKLNDARLAG